MKPWLLEVNLSPGCESRVCFGQSRALAERQQAASLKRLQLERSFLERMLARMPMSQSKSYPVAESIECCTQDSSIDRGAHPDAEFPKWLQHADVQ